jgi:hypothetical protein
MDGLSTNDKLTRDVTRALQERAPEILKGPLFSSIHYRPDYLVPWRRDHECQHYTNTAQYRVAPDPSHELDDFDVYEFAHFPAFKESLGFTYYVQIRNGQALVRTDGCAQTRPFSSRYVDRIVQAIVDATGEIKDRIEMNEHTRSSWQ